MAISASTEYIDPRLSRNSNHGDIPNRNAEISHDVCKNICRNIICNIPKLATSQVSIGISMACNELKIEKTGQRQVRKLLPS